MNLFQKCNCIYCKEHKGFPILWKLSDGNLWFEIPKNGSASIKQTHKNRTHITNFTDYNDAIPYVILRDPIDRFLSLFKHYFLKEGRRFTRSVSFCKKLNENVDLMNIQTRLNFMIDNLDKLATEEEVHHFYPQTHFINSTNFNNFNLIDIKDLSKTLNIPVSNHTAADINIHLDNKQLQYINDIYKNDYKFFDKHNFKTKEYIQ